jgi:bifunctional DNA-binding transcriptional regulator/antitoxin component of YhaV-PrlF toxin-antitoxin module
MPVVINERSTVKVSNTGTLAIPKSFLDAIAAEPGEQFKVERDGYGLRLVPVAHDPVKSIDEVAGMLRTNSKKKRGNTKTDQAIGALIKAQDDATKGR